MIHRRRTSSLLDLLLILLVALGPWPVNAGKASGGCYVAATDGGFAAALDCCDGDREGRPQQMCGDSHCPAGHGSLLSIVPSADVPVHLLLSRMDEAFLPAGYISHLSIPATPPTIASRLV